MSQIPSSLSDESAELARHLTDQAVRENQKKRLAAARNAFEEYLQDQDPRWLHDLTAFSNKVNLNRAAYTSLAPRDRYFKLMQEAYRWSSDALGNRPSLVGQGFVLSTELYEYILALQRGLNVVNDAHLRQAIIIKGFKGIQKEEVSEANRIWIEYRLSELDGNDDDLWRKVDGKKNQSQRCSIQ